MQEEFRALCEFHALREHLCNARIFTGYCFLTLLYIYIEINCLCNTPKYTLAVFDMFMVFCKHNLNVS